MRVLIRVYNEIYKFKGSTAWNWFQDTILISKKKL